MNVERILVAAAIAGVAAMVCLAILFDLINL